MATRWAYAMSAVTENRAFANQLWEVLWASADQKYRGANSDTFSDNCAFEDSTKEGAAPLVYVIHTQLLQQQYDEMVQYIGGENPRRWIDAGLTAEQLDDFRPQIKVSLGAWDAIDVGHRQFIAVRNLVSDKLRSRAAVKEVAPRA
jgi:hypothetical protein